MVCKSGGGGGEGGLGSPMQKFGGPEHPALPPLFLRPCTFLWTELQLARNKIFLHSRTIIFRMAQAHYTCVIVCIE